MHDVDVSVKSIKIISQKKMEARLLQAFLSSRKNESVE